MKYLFLLIPASLFLLSCSNTRPVAERKRTEKRKEKEIRSEIVSYALSLQGAKYRAGGKNTNGFDCSGFTAYVYGKAGIALPPSSRTQAREGVKIFTRDARPGDLLFFGRGRVSHVGIVIDNDRDGPVMIHSSSSTGVTVTDLGESDYWRKRLKYAKRLL